MNIRLWGLALGLALMATALHAQPGGPLPEPLLSERLAHVPELERATIEGAGHFVHMEKPAETARVILDFVAS